MGDRTITDKSRRVRHLKSKTVGQEHVLDREPQLRAESPAAERGTYDGSSRSVSDVRRGLASRREVARYEPEWTLSMWEG